MTTLLLALALLADAPSAPGAVINEILYHAPDDLDVEYVELHNPGDAAVDLAGWTFTAGIRYTFPEGATIAAGGHLVLASNRGLLEELYDLEPYDVFEGSLANGGETLALANARGEVVESVAYADRAPWPLAADGYSASLERICPASSAGSPANWAPSPLSEDSDRPAGTPGARNHGHSSSLPPVVRSLTVRPGVCRPGEAIGVEAVVERGGAELQSVEVLYRVVEPGNQGDEIAVSMERGAGDRFSASVPGQTANRIVRIRLRATDASGAVRLEPPENELRPARSVWVGEPVATGRIPVVQFFNAGEAEFRSAREYLENQRRSRERGRFGGFRAPRFTPEDRARMDAGRMLSTDALERAWAALVLERSPSAGKREALAGAFRAASGALDELRDELEKATDVVAFADGLDERLASVRARLIDATKQALGDVEVAADDLALLDGLGGTDRDRDRGRRGDERRPDRRGERRRGPGGFRGGPERLFNVEASLFRAAMLPGVTGEQLDRLVTLHREALAKRETLGDGLEDGDFRAMFERARAMQDELGEAVAAALGPEQRAELDDGDRGRGPFGGRGGRGDRGGRGFGGPGFGRFGTSSSPTLPARGRSAFLYTDPETRETRLFDFVHIVERKSGYKVRLHRDRPLDGMTTINVLHDPNERSILTEALAYDLYRLAGNATPRAGYLRVLIDGQVAGYHLVFEQPNGAFFRRHDVDGGNLYKIIWQGSNRASRFTPASKVPERQDLVRRHEKKTNPHDGYEDLIELIEALERTGDPAELWEVVQRRFDVDQVINYFAVNTLLSHWDGFFNNYFLYHDTATGKWTMYPWDQDSTWGHRMNRGDEVFAEMPLTFGMEGDVPPGAEPRREGRGGFGFGRRGGAGWWRPGGEISRPLLANPEFRRRYLARLEELARSVYTEEVFVPRFEALRAQLEDEVRLRARMSEQSEEEALRELDETLAFFREHLVKRREYILANVGKAVLTEDTSTRETPRGSERRTRRR